MTMTLSRSRIAALVVVVALAVAAAFLLVLRSTGLGRMVGSAESIPTPDGVRLSAMVIVPDRSGPHPLVVMPASWGASENQYAILGRELADSGYEVVAYAQRGGGESTGLLDYAGDATQRDASTVISWALRHTEADPKRIGMMGASYGAGVSLLAAERDPRIGAVVALSTWTDLGAVNIRHGTLATQAAVRVMGNPKTRGRLDGDTSQLLRLVQTDPQAAIERFRELSGPRSAMSHVADLNSNKTAVFISNGYEDSIMPSGQFEDFFQALTAPKRLQLAPGDHLAPEINGFYGKPNDVTDTARRWLDHFLRGEANGVDREAPIQLKDSTTGRWHGYHTWPSADVTVELGTPGPAGGTFTSDSSAWQSDVVAGTDTIATSGPPSVTPSENYEPATAQLSAPVTSHGLSWYGRPTDRPELVSGTPRLTLSLGSDTGRTTLFTYLYDVAPSGVARLMSMAPCTTTGDQARSGFVALSLQPISWTIPRGHRLALVVDTVDPRYHSDNPAGGTVTVSSTDGRPATLDLPLTR